MCSQSYNIYRQGAMQASPLHSTPPPPLRGLSNGSHIGVKYVKVIEFWFSSMTFTLCSYTC